MQQIPYAHLSRNPKDRIADRWEYFWQIICLTSQQSILLGEADRRSIQLQKSMWARSSIRLEVKDACYEEPSTHGAYEESMTFSLRDLSKII